MKKIYFTVVGLFIGLTSFAQTSVQNGNWMNPTTWDCTCIPNVFSSALNITINHTVVGDFNSGGIYFSGGSLTIGPNGTLMQTGPGDLYMDNATTLVNGTLDMRRIAIEGGTATYNGTIQNCDSLWNDNSVVINNGTVTCYDHQVAENGDMTNNGSIHMTNNMNIQGKYTNSASGTLVVDIDFSNANTVGGRAFYINNGDHQIANDFLNATNDTIQGTGTFCIGGLSTNQGKILGTITFTLTGGAFSVNSGFVAPSVNFIDGSCALSIVENKEAAVSLYPNPFSSIINLSGLNNISKIEILNLNGQVVNSKSTSTSFIDLSNLENGIYMMRITTSNNKIILKKIVKE